MHSLLMKNDFLKVEYGCPASNFTQEMASWNRGFNAALNELIRQWTKVMTATIEKGKKNGFIRTDVNAKQVTTFIMSGYWGIRNFGKLENSKRVYQLYLKELLTHPPIIFLNKTYQLVFLILFLRRRKNTDL